MEREGAKGVQANGKDGQVMNRGLKYIGDTFGQYHLSAYHTPRARQPRGIIESHLQSLAPAGLSGGRA